jgi:hypothetical protein
MVARYADAIKPGCGLTFSWRRALGITKAKRRRPEVARESAALAADEADRAEMAAVASLMESMRAAG